MQRALIIALWIIAANLTWATVRDGLTGGPAHAQGKGPTIADVMSCDYLGRDCVVRTFQEKYKPQ